MLHFSSCYVKPTAVLQTSLTCTVNMNNPTNKSENATPELFAIYIQNYANQETK